MSFDDSHVPKSQAKFWLGMGIILFMLWMLCGCSFALISKADIHEHLTLFRAYRNFVQVKPEFDAETVNKGADDMELTLEAWRGEFDADE